MCYLIQCNKKPQTVVMTAGASCYIEIFLSAHLTFIVCVEGDTVDHFLKFVIVNNDV